jgi:hypothetical protein
MSAPVTGSFVRMSAFQLVGPPSVRVADGITSPVSEFFQTEPSGSMSSPA